MKKPILYLLFILVVSGLAAMVLPGAFSGETSPSPLIEPFPLPKALSLCGEPMPLNDPAVREMLDRELHNIACDRARVLLVIKRAGRYFPYVEKRLAELRMPDDLKYLSVAESSLLPYAKSPAGALGPWQFIQATGVRMGLRYDSTFDERLDFERATEAALSYLNGLKEMFGSWTAAMAAYNCGENRIRTEMYEQRVTDYYRLDLYQETERYIFRIAAFKLVMENPAQYGYRIPKDQMYSAFACEATPVDIRYSIHIADLAQALGTDYKILKELNPQILGRQLPQGKYTLKIPHGTGPKLKRFLETTPPPEVSKEEPKGVYTVKQGDTLVEVSRKTGVPVETLKRLNSIQGSHLTPGQKLRVAP
jgi:membrane-bound lytic murein transglycosylase D